MLFIIILNVQKHKNNIIYLSVIYIQIVFRKYASFESKKYLNLKFQSSWNRNSARVDGVFSMIRRQEAILRFFIVAGQHLQELAHLIVRCKK